MKPHKHSELIKLWADGAEIEYRHWGSEWKPVKSPTWDEGWEYRIKQKTIVRYLWANINGSISTTFASADEVNLQGYPKQWIRLEWSRTEFPE